MAKVRDVWPKIERRLQVGMNVRFWPIAVTWGSGTVTPVLRGADERFMEALAATAILGLVVAVVCWLARLFLTDKATEAKSAFLHQYVEILRQLENIAELEREFNALCAGQSLGRKLDVELLEQAVALIRADFDEIEKSPAWKVLGRYPKYWHHAEIHARYFAPMEGQLRDSIAELEHATAR